MKIARFVICFIPAPLRRAARAFVLRLERIHRMVVTGHETSSVHLHRNCGDTDNGGRLAELLQRILAEEEVTVTPFASCVTSEGERRAVLSGRLFEISDWLDDQRGVDDNADVVPRCASLDPTCHSLRVRHTDARRRGYCRRRRIESLNTPSARPCRGFDGTFAMKSTRRNLLLTSMYRCRCKAQTSPL